MNEEERQDEQTPRRPRVVDKRISARAAEAEGSEAAAPPAGPAPEAAPPEPPGPSSSPAQEPAPAPAPADQPGPAPDLGEQVWTPEQEERAAQMAQEIADTPSFEWVVNTCVTLANVAATKLELGAGGDAQLAIDALAGLINAVGPRLQQAESPLRQTLAQLQLAYAQRLSPPGPPG